LFHLLDAGRECRIQFSVLEPGKSMKLAPSLICTPLAVRHHPSSLGFLFDFEKENKKLLYSGDTGAHPPFFRAARDADFLVHDCSAPQRFFLNIPSLSEVHTHSRELGRMAEEAGVRTLVPCHFFSNYDFEITEIVDEIRERFDGNLILPEDMNKIALFE
jgi:ribonuclease Z